MERKWGASAYLLAAQYGDATEVLVLSLDASAESFHGAGAFIFTRKDQSRSDAPIRCRSGAFAEARGQSRLEVAR